MKLFSLCVAFFLHFVCQESLALRIDFNPHDAISTTTSSTTTTPSPLNVTPQLSKNCLKVFKDCRKACFLFSCSTCYSLVIGCAFEEVFPPKGNTTMMGNGTTQSNSAMNGSTTMNPMSSTTRSSNSTTNKPIDVSMSNSTTVKPMARNEFDNPSMPKMEGSGFHMNSSALPMENSTLPSEGSGYPTDPSTRPMEGSGI